MYNEDLEENFTYVNFEDTLEEEELNSEGYDVRDFEDEEI